MGLHQKGNELTVEIRDVDTSTTLLGFEVSLRLSSVRILSVVLLAGEDGFGDEGLALHTIAQSRLSDTKTVGHIVGSLGLFLGLHAAGEKGVAGGISDVHDTFFRDARGLKEGHIVADQTVKQGLVLFVQVLRADDVNLVDHDECRFVGEQRLDRVEELALCQSKH